MKTKCLFTVIFAGSALAAQSTIVSFTGGTALVGNRGANMLVNGSFEAQVGSYLNNSFWSTGTTNTPYIPLTGWTASGGPNSYAIWGNGGTPAAGVKGSAPIPHGEVGLYFGALVVQSVAPAPVFHPNGRVTFPGAPNIVPAAGFGPVTLEQTVTLNTGQQYLLDFWASGEDAQNGGWNPGVFGLDITGENTIYAAAPSGSGMYGGYQRYKVVFQPTSSVTTIKFTNWGHMSLSNGFTSELCLDDVILNPVPEVPAWPGFLAGLAAIGRRRKKA